MKWLILRGLPARKKAMLNVRRMLDRSVLHVQKKDSENREKRKARMKKSIIKVTLFNFGVIPNTKEVIIREYIK